jgi:hypothetical protein
VREKLRVTGQVHRAVQIWEPAGPGDRLVENDDFRFIQLNAGESKLYHGVGPGIEFEGDVSRTGPFVLSVYLSGQAYRFFGNLDVDLSDTNEFGETANWSFSKQAWGWRARVGLRFQWLPE